MRVVVLADDAGKEEFMSKNFPPHIQVSFVNNLAAMITDNTADAFFILTDRLPINDNHTFEGKPVFINSTIETLQQLKLHENFSRLNGWPGFLNRQVWEVATMNEGMVKNIFDKLSLDYILVDDEPGFVSARIIAMIINEAYFALGEDVSSKEEIDVAMKLGTNYPYGPFEWSKKIGLKKISTLLEKLSETDSCYTSAPAMKSEIANI